MSIIGPKHSTDGLKLLVDFANKNCIDKIDIPIGQEVFTNIGTQSWTCPANVTSVSVVCVGGGGGGGHRGTHVTNGSSGQGGYGGGLGYKNNISVTPGNSYSVIVGQGGGPGSSNSAGSPGGDSTFEGVYGRGGPGGLAGSHASVHLYQLPATYTGDGGGNGGLGGKGQSTTGSPGNTSGGGGGAGGYSGAGGAGGNADAPQTYTSGSAGSGGAGGGGSSAGDSGAGHRIGSGGGGGVGLLGEGSSGGSTSTPTSGSGTYGGKGGSGGADAADNPWNIGDTFLPGSDGALYGGGGGGHSMAQTGRSGAQGAVRIMWGPNRSYPSTNTEDQSGSVDGVSNTLFNLVNTNETLTITGATYNSNQGGYLEFDGDDSIEASNSDHAIFGLGDFAVEVWVNINSDTGNEQVIMEYWHNNFGWQLHTHSADRQIGWRQNSSPIYWNLAPGGDSYNTGSWYHVVATREYPTFKLYVNGILKTLSNNTATYGSPSSSIVIGKRKDGTDKFLDGKISMANIYNGKSLTAEEVKQHFNSFKGRYGI